MKPIPRILWPTGVSIVAKRSTGEYRVNYIGASERYAYYTEDHSDALATAHHMADHRPAELKPDLRIGRSE